MGPRQCFGVQADKVCSTAILMPYMWREWRADGDVFERDHMVASLGYRGDLEPLFIELGVGCRLSTWSSSLSRSKPGGSPRIPEFLGSLPQRSLNFPNAGLKSSAMRQLSCSASQTAIEDGTSHRTISLSRESS